MARADPALEAEITFCREAIAVVVERTVWAETEAERAQAEALLATLAERLDAALRRLHRV